jgi:hypothetical protein
VPVLSAWRIGLFAAQRKAFAFAAITLIITILAGVVVLVSVLASSMTASPTTPGSLHFSTTAKVQAVADGLLCVKMGHGCADFNATVTYLDAIIADNAVYATSGSTVVTLTKTLDGWQSWADAILADTSGAPLNFSEAGQLVTFTWGTSNFEASFTTSGDDQRLLKLTRGVNGS